MHASRPFQSVVKESVLRTSAASVLLFCASCSSQDATPAFEGAVEFQTAGPADLELSGVVAVARTSSGSIVVGDRGQPGIRIVREDGRVRSLGRAGSGPGEFEALTRVQLCRDGTIAAYDFAQARVHFFSEDGFLKQMQLPPSLVTGDLVGCVSSDSMIFSRLPDQVPGIGLHTVPITLFVYTPPEQSPKWLATLRGTEMFFSERYQAFYERPYGLQTLLTFGRNGVVFAENSRIQLFRILGDGSTSPIFLLPHTSQGVRRDFREQYVRDRVAEEPDSSARTVIRGVLDEVDWAKNVPPIDRIVASTTGESWVRRTPVGEDKYAQWLVVDSFGQVSATLLLPRQIRVMFVDDTEILGVEELATGEERLVRALRSLR